MKIGSRTIFTLADFKHWMCTIPIRPRDFRASKRVTTWLSDAPFVRVAVDGQEQAAKNPEGNVYRGVS